MATKETVPDEDQYTLEEAAAVIERAVARKRSEIDSLKRRMARLKNPGKRAANQAMIDYLEADVVAYITVIADMRDDDTIAAGLDLDGEPVPVPEDYQDYIDGLSADDLENEQEAEMIRADYCDGVVEEMCVGIGEYALSSKKMIKAMLDDPYAMEQVGEMIFYDDYLYDLFQTLSQSKDGKDEKSGKKKKKKK